jgi:drug/metabolite transporter (DMT)-like permease
MVLLASKTEKPGTVLFWKYIFGAAWQWIATTLYLGGPSKTLDHLLAAGYSAPLGALFLTSLNALLSLSFIHTTSANALLLFSLHVVWAALGGALFLRDHLPKRTWAMVAVGLGSAVAIFLGGGHGGSDTRRTIEGDLMAACSGACFASLMLLFRSRTNISPDVSTLPTTCLGSTMAIFVGVALAGGDVWPEEPSSALPLLLLDGMMIAGAMLVYAASPKNLNAAEITLICLLEPALGPVFVYFGMGEAPSPVSIGAGCVFILCLIAHEVAGMRGAANKKGPEWVERHEKAVEVTAETAL